MADEEIKSTYVAVVDIKRVDHVTHFEGQGGYRKPTDTSRRNNSLAKLIIKDDDLEQLRSKVTAHVNLIDDIADGQE